MPSSISREAPPPVEMWDILDSNLAVLTAATESPPPMIVMPPFCVISASAWATPNVPLENCTRAVAQIGAR